jgi:hypothetical protein
MTEKIEWHNFSQEEPPRLNDFYLIEDTGGNIYLDEWIHRPFENWEGQIIENKWANTHRGYVERWATIDNISLREYAELIQSEN